MGRTRSHGMIFWLTAGLLSTAFLLSLGGGAEAQSGGAISVTIRAGGQDAEGSVKVMTAEAEPREVAKGKTGRPISVPSGRYDVHVTCTEMLDHPTQELRGVTVSGETVEREVTFPAGTLTLHVKRGGRVLKNKQLTLRTKAGEELPGKARTGQAFKVTPGTYEAEIVLGRKQKHSITGIQAYEGAIRHLPVEL